MAALRGATNASHTDNGYSHLGNMSALNTSHQAPARRQTLAGFADFRIHKFKQCRGTKGSTVWGTILPNWQGGESQCMQKCRDMEGCAGFVRISSGTRAGKCFFRGGYITKIRDFSPDSRDCFQYIGRPLTCLQEHGIRELMKTELDASSPSSTVVRAVFHDSVDRNNLMLQNKRTNVWELIEGPYGGVDGCLYSPLSGEDSGVHRADHNRNILSTLWDLPKMWCTRLCRSALKNTWLCSNHDACVVELMVLLSLETIESAGGPPMLMKWGRKKGDCEAILVTPFSKDPVKLQQYTTKPALHLAPALTQMEQPHVYRNVFHNFGYNVRQQVALMGAHTFGQVEVCAGGFNGIEHGPFCGHPEKTVPVITPTSLTKTCVPSKGLPSGQGGKACWTRRGNWLRPAWRHKAGWTAYGFGDGGFFDTTPHKFDNTYFKLFAHENFDAKDNCCGKVKHGACHRDGPMERVVKRHETTGRILQSVRLQGTEVGEQACQVQWCRSDRKGRSHMKSTVAWHEPPHQTVKHPALHGMVKRIVRLAADWALLGLDETREVVLEFADNETSFHEAFADAWGEVVTRGYDVAQMALCTGDKPSKSETVEFSKKMQEVAYCADKYDRCRRWNWQRKQRRCRTDKWAKQCPLTCGRCSLQMRDDDR